MVSLYLQKQQIKGTSKSQKISLFIIPPHQKKKWNVEHSIHFHVTAHCLLVLSCSIQNVGFFINIMLILGKFFIHKICVINIMVLNMMQAKVYKDKIIFLCIKNLLFCSFFLSLNCMQRNLLPRALKTKKKRKEKSPCLKNASGVQS